MLGEFGVGKTSLVRRFVHSIFSDRYMTTVGVKIDTKEVEVEDGKAVKLIVWDIAGSDNIDDLEKRYIKGASGYLLVADGTRPDTLNVALGIDKTVQELTKGCPRILLINKDDLKSEWRISDDQMIQIRNEGIEVYTTSALTGNEVEQSFQKLASQL
jgi:small GTP-binding protein